MNRVNPPIAFPVHAIRTSVRKARSIVGTKTIDVREGQREKSRRNHTAKPKTSTPSTAMLSEYLRE